MKALSIRQPWAWLVVNGLKDIENRTWYTKQRGVILIHAGKQVDHDGYDRITHDFPDIQLPTLSQLPRGGIVGEANLMACVTRHHSPWMEGPYGFVFQWGRPLKFMKFPGELGFFDVEYRA